MTRKGKCSNCRDWYYNDNGLMISRPDTYDGSMCENCNSTIDADIKTKELMDLRG